MQIYINNTLAALKQGTSFEYVSENRLFSGSDGYTLTITFPLRGCPQNLAIFGHIHRADVVARKVVFDCEIRDRGFYKFGCITVTEINEAEVKTQFLDGRSEQNFDETLNEIYINELDLGEQPLTMTGNITPAEAWAVTDQTNIVALPWVNDASGNMQNEVSFNYNTGAFEWKKGGTGLSWQPYLIYITRKICEAIGYAGDFSAWEARDDLRYLLICNTLPFSWYKRDFARVLPHWTVEEYFEKLEPLLDCEFNIDHRAKRISLAFTKEVLAQKPDIRLDEIIEQHSVEVKSEESQCEYSESTNLVYKECDHDMWKYYACDWYMQSSECRPILEYDSIEALLADVQQYHIWDGGQNRTSSFNAIFHAKDYDMYFINRALSRTENGKDIYGNKVYQYTCTLQPINAFGGRIVDASDNAASREVEFVPVRVDYTDEVNGRAMFLSFSGYDEEQEEYDSNAFRNSSAVNAIEAGEKEKSAEYYDRIYVGWWDGKVQLTVIPPWPNVYECDVVFYLIYFANRNNFSLRLNNRNRKRGIHAIEPTMRCTFKFIADTIPDVRSLFIIRGKRYICEKITATFTEEGMSQLLKGVFYPVADD